MVWIVGHRGSPEEEVENTLPSFTRALERDGANALEMDISVTRDGELLVWHDYDPRAFEARVRRWGLEPVVLARPRRTSRALGEMTLAEARREVGYEVRTHVVDAHVPTLAEVFDWARPRSSLGLVFLDLKIDERPDLVPTFLERLDALVAAARPRFAIVVESASVTIARALRHEGVRYPLALDVPKKSRFDDARELHVEWTCPRRPRTLALTKHAVGQRCPFTVNDAEEMRALLDIGVDAIQTDRPALLASVVHAAPTVGSPRRAAWSTL